MQICACVRLVKERILPDTMHIGMTQHESLRMHICMCWHMFAHMCARNCMVLFAHAMRCACMRERERVYTNSVCLSNLRRPATHIRNTIHHAETWSCFKQQLRVNTMTQRQKYSRHSTEAYLISWHDQVLNETIQAQGIVPAPAQECACKRSVCNVVLHPIPCTQA